jgi:hypothetical protein
LQEVAFFVRRISNKNENAKLKIKNAKSRFSFCIFHFQ